MEISLKIWKISFKKRKINNQIKLQDKCQEGKSRLSMQNTWTIRNLFWMIGMTYKIDFLMRVNPQPKLLIFHKIAWIREIKYSKILILMRMTKLRKWNIQKKLSNIKMFKKQ